MNSHNREARGIRGWESKPFRFQAGDTIFVRHFAESSPEARYQLARAWAKEKNYVLVGPA